MREPKEICVKQFLTLAVLLACSATAAAQTKPDALEELKTKPEATNFQETSRYQEVVDFMNAVAKAAAKLTRAGSLLSVAGGGDTVAALAHAGVEHQFSYVSTAGGAFLEWLEGKELPGVAALTRR